MAWWNRSNTSTAAANAATKASEAAAAKAAAERAARAAERAAARAARTAQREAARHAAALGRQANALTTAAEKAAAKAGAATQAAKTAAKTAAGKTPGGFFSMGRRWGAVGQIGKEAVTGGGKGAKGFTGGILGKSGRFVSNVMGALALPFEGMARVARTRPGKAVLGFAIVASSVAAIGAFLGHRHKVTREERETQAADREMAISNARQEGFRGEMRQFAADMSAMPDLNPNAKGGNLARLQAREAEAQAQGPSGGRVA